MHNLLPPPDREEFEKRIDDLFERLRGSKDSFARYLGVHPSMVSKRLNPYNEEHISAFYKVVFDLAHLRSVSPDLAREVWREIRTEVEKLLLITEPQAISATDSIAEIHAKVGELYRAKADGKPLNELISRTVQVEISAKQAKEQFIAVRNEIHTGEGVN